MAISSSTASPASAIAAAIASSAFESVSTPCHFAQAILQRVEIVVEVTFHDLDLGAWSRVRENADHPKRPVM
jgi:hypothetical protein